MDRRERERIMNQGVVRPETPRQRRERETLQEDVAPLAGRKVEQRLRNFRPDAASYFAALGGPLPYMTRLRAIDVQTREHEHQLEEAWRGLAAELGDDERRFAEEWRALVGRWSFDEVNDLIARHNHWYPVESRLPMDPRTGDYARINGEDFRREPLGVDWALSRFPPRPPRVEAA